MDSDSIIAAARPETGGRPPAVLQILPRLDVGGVERGTIEVAAALVQAGWKSVVASAGGMLVRELERGGTRHVELPLASKNPWTIRANAGRLADLIEAERIDIVHARSRAPAWSAFWAARRTGRVFVTTFHGAYSGTSWFKRRYNSVMARGDRVIAISRFIADHAMAGYGVPADRIRIIERGIDVDRFHPDRVTTTRVVQLAQAWRLPDGAPLIMLPGRLSRLKGQLVLVDALARLGRREVCCLFIGAGGHGFRKELEKRIRRLGVGDLCRFVDHCADMPAAYMLADVVVSASTRPEGFGRIIAEGLAMGRLVIATDHGGARELVIPRETGWLVPPNDAVSLAQALSEALTLAPLQRMLFADNAMRSITERFGSGLMTERTIEVYEELLFSDARSGSIVP